MKLDTKVEHNLPFHVEQYLQIKSCTSVHICLTSLLTVALVRSNFMIERAASFLGCSPRQVRSLSILHSFVNLKLAEQVSRLRQSNKHFTFDFLPATFQFDDGTTYLSQG